MLFVATGEVVGSPCLSKMIRGERRLEERIATKVEKDVGVLQAVGMVFWISPSRIKPGYYDTGVTFSGLVTP